MPVKIENQYEGKLPRNTVVNIESALDSVPNGGAAVSDI